MVKSFVEKKKKKIEPDRLLRPTFQL